MTRAVTREVKPSGRPRVHLVTEKPCGHCGRIFTMEERGVKHPSWFADFKYCSKDCGAKARFEANGVEKLRERIASNSEFQPNGCVVWTGKRTAKGYGQLSFRGRDLRAHRVAYELANGPIPDGLMILHGCDNPPCINPQHLRPGTALDNFNDCIGRGRAAWQQS